MMNQVHGHEVMRMMLASGKPYTKTTLAEDIISTFGKDARFHTCSAADMTAEGIVEFLEAAGKFVPVEGGLQTAPNKMCSH
jgi:probable metal-binding protein